MPKSTFISVHGKSSRLLKAELVNNLIYALIFGLTSVGLGAYWTFQYHEGTNKLLFLFFSFLSGVYTVLCSLAVLDRYRLFRFINSSSPKKLNTTRI